MRNLLSGSGNPERVNDEATAHHPDSPPELNVKPKSRRRDWTTPAFLLSLTLVVVGVGGFSIWAAFMVAGGLGMALTALHALGTLRETEADR